MVWTRIALTSSAPMLKSASRPKPTTRMKSAPLASGLASRTALVSGALKGSSVFARGRAATRLPSRGQPPKGTHADTRRPPQIPRVRRHDGAYSTQGPRPLRAVRQGAGAQGLRRRLQPHRIAARAHDDRAEGRGA